MAQVFLEAWRQRTRVQLMNGSLRSWLLGVASNLVKRHWRQRERRNRAIGRLPRTVSATDHADEVAERLDGQRRLVAVQERLAGMPRAQIEVLLLWAWEELSYEEIAAVVGVPVGTVRSRLSRARAHLNGPEGTAVRNRAFPDRRDATEDDPPATDLGRSTG